MNCTTTDLILIAGFFVSLLLANFSSWRMQKNANLDGYKGPQWKLWLGDVSLPKNHLLGSGKFWRVISIWSFVAVVVCGVGIGFLNSNGSNCFGITT